MITSQKNSVPFKPSAPSVLLKSPALLLKISHSSTYTFSHDSNNNSDYFSASILRPIEYTNSDKYRRMEYKEKLDELVIKINKIPSAKSKGYQKYKSVLGY